MKRRLLGLTMALMIILNGTAIFAEIERPKEISDNKMIDIEERENKSYRKLFSVSELNGYRKNETNMLPLRVVSEALGFQVQWDGELRQVCVSKDARNISLKSGENYYMVARKTPVKLSEAPEIKDDITYVPIEFFREILKHQLIIAGDDLAIIMEKKVEEEKEETLQLEGYIKYINEIDGDISILVDVKNSDIELDDIYIHIVEESNILNGNNEEIGLEEIKVGSRVKATTPKMMTMSIPPQTTGKEIIIEEFIEINQLDKNGIKYPELKFNKNKVVESYFQQAILEFVEEMEITELFKDLKMEYMISSLDSEKISIIFRGNYDFIGQEKEVIRTLNLDLRSGEVIRFENYFKSDGVSQRKLKNIIQKATRIQHNKEFEAEGIQLYFTEDFIVLFYYELDDSVRVPTEIYLEYEEVEELINSDLGKIDKN